MKKEDSKMNLLASTTLGNIEVKIYKTLSGYYVLFIDSTMHIMSSEEFVKFSEFLYHTVLVERGVNA